MNITEELNHYYLYFILLVKITMIFFRLIKIKISFVGLCQSLDYYTFAHYTISLRHVSLYFLFIDSTIRDWHVALFPSEIKSTAATIFLSFLKRLEWIDFKHTVNFALNSATYLVISLFTTLLLFWDTCCVLQCDKYIREYEKMKKPVSEVMIESSSHQLS